MTVVRLDFSGKEIVAVAVTDDGAEVLYVLSEQELVEVDRLLRSVESRINSFVQEV